MWKPYFSSFNSCFCSCKSNFDENIEDEFGNAAKAKVRFCTAKKISWRELPGSFVQKMPNSIGPQAMLRLLWWFSQRLPIEQIMEYTCLSAYSVREGLVQIRKAIGVKMMSLQDSEMLGDRPNTVVCVDETFFSKKKNRGGFVGRITVGMTKIVLGFFELDLTTKMGTGRMRLIQIAARSRAHIETAIRAVVVAGATIWTDGFSSYKWLGKHARRGFLSPVSGYVWDWVNHRRGQFAKFARNGQGQLWRVSTNSVEGLFSRVKKFMRFCRITNVGDKDYGLLLMEFMWRERFLSGRALGPRDGWRQDPRTLKSIR